MKIIWVVEDGYVGKDRPQETMVDDEDLMECGSLEEMKELVEETVQGDFNLNISWGYRDQQQTDAALSEIVRRKGKQFLEQAETLKQEGE